MKKDLITISKIKHHSNIKNSLFLEVYKKLILGQELSKDNLFYLLKVGVLFLNSTNQHVKQLGYRIVLKYSNKYNDYIPLYDVSLQLGYVPIVKFIENRTELDEDHIANLMLSAYHENFSSNVKGSKIFKSYGQMLMAQNSSKNSNFAIVAPTSYGKSDMIINKTIQNIDLNICIIVPTKALISQTRNNLYRGFEADDYVKIITHPDMYSVDDNGFIGVMTQERLLRLLKTHNELKLDLLVLDEAHNLLGDDGRNRLTAQVILILQKRNQELKIDYYTPFLSRSENLQVVNFQSKISQFKTIEKMKSENFYIFDTFKGQESIYDPFLNKSFFVKNNNIKVYEYIIERSTDKNIVYFNRPAYTQKFADSFIDFLDDIEMDEYLNEAINSISELIDPEYFLIKCLKKGLVYHHGGVPEVIKSYIESIYSKNSKIMYLITTSTLLEGVNIPAERMFILDAKKGRSLLTRSQFKNLIGRVGRFNEIFDEKRANLELLEPEIHLVKSSYCDSRFNAENFYNKRLNVEVEDIDIVLNPLLINTENNEDTQEALEYVEHIETGSSGLQNILPISSQIGKLCFINNIGDFNIMENITTLDRNLQRYMNEGIDLISSPMGLMDGIYLIFLVDIILNEDAKNIARLQDNKEARNFYTMFIGWRADGAVYPKMISSFLNYWNKRILENDPIIYIGSRWGEMVYNGGHRKLYVDLRKTHSGKVNLAIAKIKEEQEYVDYHVMKYAEILNDLKLIEPQFYDTVKYRTSNLHTISLLKIGLSFDLSTLLIKKYKSLIIFSEKSEFIKFKNTIINALEDGDENKILIFELSQFI
jgi:hypothetical protein